MYIYIYIYIYIYPGELTEAADEEAVLAVCTAKMANQALL